MGQGKWRESGYDGRRARWLFNSGGKGGDR